MGEVGEVVVHWRPGCGFCSMLFRGLDRDGVRYRRRDIWEDDDAAAFVRRHADGNETVPTVAIGEVVLVNPSPERVVEVARVHAPGAVAPDAAAPDAAATDPAGVATPGTETAADDAGPS